MEDVEALEAMSVEDLQARVDAENAGAAPAESGQATAEATPSEGAVEAPKTPSADEPPAWYVKHQEELRRELGSLRKLQGMSDKMPRMIQEQIRQEIAKLQQNQNLSPEDRENQAQLQTQQEALARFVREQARAEFGDVGKDYIKLLDELKEQRQDMSHKSSALDLVKDTLNDNADSAWEAVFEQSVKDIEAGKPGALERQERLEKDPAFVALEMIRSQQGKVQTQAKAVTEQRQSMARQAAQGVKPNSVPQSGKKAVSEMSAAELEGLSIDELEAALPEQAR